MIPLGPTPPAGPAGPAGPRVPGKPGAPVIPAAPYTCSEIYIYIYIEYLVKKYKTFFFVRQYFIIMTCPNDMSAVKAKTKYLQENPWHQRCRRHQEDPEKKSKRVKLRLRLS